ncbi:MAG: efflux RND transporter periplasmic adaptor subunit [Planctomycetaceae bacterium]|nr:efflux RND transporter periplasmic adaptor subunit [Planctomycetaceae bacterium]
MIRRALAGVLLLLILLAGLWYSQGQSEPRRISGFIEADDLRLGSRVGGRVAKVHVAEGEEVKSHHVLVELEPYDLLQKRAQAEASNSQLTAQHQKLVDGYREEEIGQAEARVEAAQANLLKLRNGPREQEIEMAQAQVKLADAELELADEVYDRTIKLQEKGAETAEAVDRAIKEKRAAEERLTSAKEALELLQEGTRPEEISAAAAQLREAEQALKLLKNGYRQEEIDEAYFAKRGAESALAAIDIQLEELKVRAPTDGTVEAIDLRPGDLVMANAPVVSMVDLSRLWVRAYLPEDEMDVRLGTKFPVTVDSYPGETFTGEVTFIARQAEFTPGNVQTPEERSKQVFRIKVHLLDGLDRLRPGMAADIWLDDPR